MKQDLKTEVQNIINQTNVLKTLNLEVELNDRVPVNSFKELTIYCIGENLNNHNGDKFQSIYSEITNINPSLLKLSLGIYVQFVFKNCVVDFMGKYVEFLDSVFFHFENSTINIYIEYKNSIKNLIISNKHYRNCTFKQISVFTNLENIHIDLIYTKIDNLQLHRIDLLKENLNKIKIINSEISNFNIQNINSEIDMFFSGITTPKNEENNNVQLIVKDSTFNGRFILKDSSFDAIFDLENVTFNKDVSFKNLSVLGIDLDSAFFNGSYNVDFSELKIKNKENLTRSTARKIKHILEKDSNKIEANLYHSYELKARKSELESQSLSINNFLDKIVFFFNEKTSNHGLNWALPIYWMIFIGLFYSSYFYTSNFNLLESLLFWISILSSIYIFLKFKITKIKKYFFAFLPSFLFYSVITWFNNDFGFDSIFKFLNIISFEKDINISLAESTISKAIMAYLIYQFVISLRKDTRK